MFGKWLVNGGVIFKMESVVIICDLKGLAKWMTLKDGRVLLDQRYLNEWNKRSGS